MMKKKRFSVEQKIVGVLSKPIDNAFVECFNGTFRSECLNTHWLLDLKEARQLIEAFVTKTVRPR